MRAKYFMFLLCSYFLILGCTGSKLSKEESMMIREMQPPEGKALVYVIRPSDLGFFFKMKIAYDGKYVGATGARQFLYIIADPGQHVLSSTSENTSELLLNIKAGKRYYVEQQASMGLAIVRNILAICSEVDGHAKLLKCFPSADVKK